MSDLESTDSSSNSERSSSSSERSSSEPDESSDSDSDPCSDPDYDPEADPRSINKVWRRGYSSYRRHDDDKTENEDKGYHDNPDASQPKQRLDQSYDSARDTDSPGATASRKQRKEQKPQYKTRTLHYYWKSQKPQAESIEVTPSKALRKQPGVSEVFSDEEFSLVTLKENNPTAANVSGNRKRSDSGDSQAIKRPRKREQQGHADVLLDKSQSPIGISGSSSTKANAQPAADDKPNLPDLKKFTGKSGQFNILERIGTQYNDFGTFLLQDNDGLKVDAAIQKWQRDPRFIGEEIVKQWLLGKGKRPVSYATLVECLKDAKLNELAEDIESVLQ